MVIRGEWFCRSPFFYSFCPVFPQTEAKRTMKRYLISVLCIFLSICSWSQEPACTLSNPISIAETGVYKVLCLQNGNTMLLHLEPSKPIDVKVFDSTHKLIASKEHGGSELNVNVFKTSLFKGLFEVNGEAVLFFQQPYLSKQRLVRMRIDGTTGNIISEDVIGQSKSMAKPMQFYVMPDKRDGTYAILYFTDVSQFKECEVSVKFYNSKHEVKTEVPVAINRKAYDYMNVLSADVLPEGTCVTLRFSELKVNGTAGGVGDGRSAVYENYLGIYYIPKDSQVVQSRVIDLTTDVYPFYSQASYNKFANSVNVLALSYQDIVLHNGLDRQPSALTAVLFLKYDENGRDLQHAWINNSMATDYLKQQTDTNHMYRGIPVKYFTTSTGLSTVISQSYNRYQNVETNARSSVFESYFGNIGVTKFNDEGEEIWGTVLPVSQYFKSYKHYYSAFELGKRHQDQDLFSDLPEQIHNRQFVSVNAYEHNRNNYIIYNDLKENFGRSFRAASDTVYDFLTANAICYKINRKNEVTKYNLLGGEPDAEYRASFIEGADFDERRGVYATLVQVRRRDYTALRMAWCKME